LYIPNNDSIRNELLEESHDIAVSGHMGEFKTLQRLKQLYYWPNMRRSVQKYISQCQSCQLNRGSNQLPIGLLQSLEIPGKRWETVTMDLITQLPVTKKGHDAIIVFVDKHSKMVHYAATTTKCTAENVARIFFDTVVRLHGIPKSIISDRDPRFTSKFWQQLWSLCGTQLKMSTAYHPQTDGQTERANRTLEDVLRNYVSNKQNDWDDHLTAAEIAVNSSVQSSTGFTPYYLNYGDHPVLPTQFPLQYINNDSLYDMLQQLSSNLALAKKNMENARERQAHYANMSRRDVTFQVGEEVLLSTQNLKLPAGITRKLANKYTGPFKVLESVSETSYKLQLPKDWNIHPVFHVSLLKKYVANSRSSSQQTIEINNTESGNPEYEVEKIIGKRLGRDQQMEYLVLWKGYPESESTWESYDIVKDLKALDEFEQVAAPIVTQDNKTQVWRRWNKNHVQQYIMSLKPPPELDITVDKLVSMVKKHKINGEKLAEITEGLWVSMGLTNDAAKWLIKQLDQLFGGTSGYTV
jgi:hypothetical protein